MSAIFKSRLLKMADTVKTVEFCTSHHNSSLEGNCCSFFVELFLQMKKWTYQCVNCDILVKNNHVLKATWILISLIPSLCMSNIKWWFLYFLKEFLKFSSCLCLLAITFYMINEIQSERTFSILSNAPLIIHERSKERKNKITSHKLWY